MESRFVKIVFAVAIALSVGIIGMLIYLSLNNNDGSIEKVAKEKLKIEELKSRHIDTQLMKDGEKESQDNPTFVFVHTFRNNRMEYVLVGTTKYSKKGNRAKCGIIKEGHFLPGEKTGISLKDEETNTDLYLMFGYTTKNYVEINGKKKKIVNDGGWLYMYKKPKEEKKSDKKSLSIDTDKENETE